MTHPWFSMNKEEQGVFKKSVERKIAKQRQLEVGDLIRIAPWCANKFRLASVVAKNWWDDKHVLIQYMDEQGLGEEPGKAYIHNLELIDEERS